MFLFMIFLACSEKELSETADPCADLDLPECPEECPDDYASTCGEPCETEGEECGNSIGDGRVCVDGVYQCSVHAPLEAEGCNSICQQMCLCVDLMRFMVAKNRREREIIIWKR